MSTVVDLNKKPEAAPVVKEIQLKGVFYINGSPYDIFLVTKDPKGFGAIQDQKALEQATLIFQQLLDAHQGNLTGNSYLARQFGNLTGIDNNGIYGNDPKNPLKHKEVTYHKIADKLPEYLKKPLQSRNKELQALNDAKAGVLGEHLWSLFSEKIDVAFGQQRLLVTQPAKKTNGSKLEPVQQLVNHGAHALGDKLLASAKNNLPSSIVNTLSKAASFLPSFGSNKTSSPSGSIKVTPSSSTNSTDTTQETTSSQASSSSTPSITKPQAPSATRTKRSSPTTKSISFLGALKGTLSTIGNSLSIINGVGTALTSTAVGCASSTVSIGKSLANKATATTRLFEEIIIQLFKGNDVSQVNQSTDLTEIYQVVLKSFIEIREHLNNNKMDAIKSDELKNLLYNLCLAEIKFQGREINIKDLINTVIIILEKKLKLKTN